MAEKSPAVHPTRHRKVLTRALRQTGREVQKAAPRGEGGGAAGLLDVDDDEHGLVWEHLTRLCVRGTRTGGKAVGGPVGGWPRAVTRRSLAGSWLARRPGMDGTMRLLQNMAAVAAIGGCWCQGWCCWVPMGRLLYYPCSWL